MDLESLEQKSPPILIWMTSMISSKKNDIVIDYIQQSKEVFKKFGMDSKELPDYPEVLQPFYGRKIWTDSIRSFGADDTKWNAGYFIKPKENKAFTGHVIHSLKDLQGCGYTTDDFEIYVSEPLDIAAEWRCFICRDKLLGIRPYGQLNTEEPGYYHVYDPEVLKKLLAAYKTWQQRPAACSIDICVTKDGRTLVVEMNDAYSLASYGLESYLYARLLSTRWAEIMEREDEYNF